MSAVCHGALLFGERRGQILLQGREYAGGDVYELCQDEATCIVATGCVHEHIQRAPACDACADAAFAAANSGKQANCWPCKHAGCLNCPVVVVIEHPEAVLA